jgi:AcrR family transcriptional regulator
MSQASTNGARSVSAEAETRAPRADATRNREQLLAVATRVFASADDAEPSMRAIAREAGVGIATLYRHFPTREALVDAVYRDQVVRLTAGARELLGQLPPAAAMRRWMDLFGDWIATKNGMLGTLLTMIESGEIAHAQTRTDLLAAITTILDAGRAAGDLRSDVTAEDIAASLIGIFTVAPRPEHGAKASRLLNLLMDGLRPDTRPA